MRPVLRSLLALTMILAAAPALADDQPAGTAASLAVENGSSVDIEYTLTDETGRVIDSNKGEQPLSYTHGTKRLIPALEKELSGMHAGEEKKVKLAPEDAYGHSDPKAIVEVATETIPEGARQVGAQLISRSPKGEVRPVTVKEVREKTIVLDMNHPLAGKTLFFDIKVLGVAPPGAEAPATEAPAGAEAPATDAPPAESTPDR